MWRKYARGQPRACCKGDAGGLIANTAVLAADVVAARRWHAQSRSGGAAHECACAPDRRDNARQSPRARACRILASVAPAPPPAARMPRPSFPPPSLRPICSALPRSPHPYTTTTPSSPARRAARPVRPFRPASLRPPARARNARSLPRRETRGAQVGAILNNVGTAYDQTGDIGAAVRRKTRPPPAPAVGGAAALLRSARRMPIAARRPPPTACEAASPAIARPPRPAPDRVPSRWSATRAAWRSASAS